MDQSVNIQTWWFLDEIRCLCLSDEVKCDLWMGSHAIYAKTTFYKIYSIGTVEPRWAITAVIMTLFIKIKISSNFKLCCVAAVNKSTRNSFQCSYHYTHPPPHTHTHEVWGVYMSHHGVGRSVRWNCLVQGITRTLFMILTSIVKCW